MIFLKIGKKTINVRSSTLNKVHDAQRYIVHNDTSYNARGGGVLIRTTNKDYDNDANWFFLGDSDLDHISSKYLTQVVPTKAGELLKIPHTNTKVPLKAKCTVKDILQILIDLKDKSVPIDEHVIMNLCYRNDFNSRYADVDTENKTELDLRNLIDGKIKYIDYWNADHNCIELQYGLPLSKKNDIWTIITAT